MAVIIPGESFYPSGKWGSLDPGQPTDFRNFDQQKLIGSFRLRWKQGADELKTTDLGGVAAFSQNSSFYQGGYQGGYQDGSRSCFYGRKNKNQVLECDWIP